MPHTVLITAPTAALLMAAISSVDHPRSPLPVFSCGWEGADDALDETGMGLAGETLVSVGEPAADMLLPLPPLPSR